MLISGSTGLMNVFIEPQFAALCEETLFTVQASDFKTFQELELASYAEHLLEPLDPMFPFTGFAYAWNLEHTLSEAQISEIELAKVDLSPAPSAFCWSGVLKDYDEIMFSEEFEDSIGDVRIGYCLADELEQELRAQSKSLQSIQVFPLFRIPSNHELRTIWVC